MPTHVKFTGLALVTKPDREEAALWRRMRARGDAQARELLFTRYLPLAQSIARVELRKAGLDRANLGDLEQAAYQGLLQALDRYDVERQVPFSAFARIRIAGSVRDLTADLSELGAQLAYKRKRSRDQLDSIKSPLDPKSGDMTALEKLADIAVELAIAFMLEADERRAKPLVGDLDNGFDSLAWRQLMAKLGDYIDDLPKDEMSVIRQHYENDVLFSEIAAVMGISKGRVSQLHKSALQRLRRRMGTIR